MSIKKKASITCAVAAVIAIVTGTYVDNESYKTPPSKLAPTGNTLRFSKEAMDLMGNAEGCRKDPYMCPANRLTVGVGHTGSDINKTVRQYSLDQIAKWFTTDQLSAQYCLEKNVEDYIGHRLPQSVLDAFGSFVFNNGCAKFKSYPVFRLLKQQNYTQACERLRLYNKARVNGVLVTLPGLANRRDAEGKLCVKNL